jgi:hypothetical protein
MAFVSGFLRDDSLREHDGGFAVWLGLPWMRALPWSSVQRLTLVVDGAEIPDRDVRFELTGQLLSTDELSGRWAQYWAMHHRLRLVVSRRASLGLGERLEISATAELRIPYLSVGPGKPMVVESTATKMLTVLAA